MSKIYYCIVGKHNGKYIIIAPMLSRVEAGIDANKLVDKSIVMVCDTRDRKEIVDYVKSVKRFFGNE